MTYFCPLELGQYAWRPNAAITEQSYEIWHMYDIPLIGTFKIGLQRFVFNFTEGPYEEEQEWIYWPMSDGEYSSMPEKFSTPEDFDQWLGEMAYDKHLWVATTEEYKLTGWKEDHCHA